MIIFLVLPESFYKIFTTKETYIINTAFAFDIYFRKLRIFNLSNLNKKELLHNSKFYEDKEILKHLSNQEKFELLTIVRFYDGSISFVTEIAKKYKENIEYLDLENFLHNYRSLNKDFNLSETENLEIFKKYFRITFSESSTVLQIQLESFFNFFNKKFSIKIPIDDFLNISLKSFIKLYDIIETQLKQLFDINAQKGMLFYTNFDAIIQNIFKNTDNRWKTMEYFTYYLILNFSNAIGQSEKEFLMIEEYIQFCLNNNDIIRKLLESHIGEVSSEVD